MSALSASHVFAEVLPPGQLRFLHVTWRLAQEQGTIPTMTSCRKALGFRSPNAIPGGLLKLLNPKGLIRYLPGPSGTSAGYFLAGARMVLRYEQIEAGERLRACLEGRHYAAPHLTPRQFTWLECLGDLMVQTERIPTIREIAALDDCCPNGVLLGVIAPLTRKGFLEPRTRSSVQMARAIRLCGARLVPTFTADAAGRRLEAILSMSD